MPSRVLPGIASPAPKAGVPSVATRPVFDRKASVPSKLDRHSEQLAALGSPLRLAILRFVVQGGDEGVSAGEIQTKVDVPASTLSHHLERLSSAGLLTSRRQGTFIYYQADYRALRALTDYLWEDCCKRGKGDCC